MTCPCSFCFCFFVAFEIKRSEEFGGNVQYTDYESVEKDFAAEVCLSCNHPMMMTSYGDLSVCLPGISAEAASRRSEKCSRS